MTKEQRGDPIITGYNYKIIDAGQITAGQWQPDTITTGELHASDLSLVKKIGGRKNE